MKVTFNPVVNFKANEGFKNTNAVDANGKAFESFTPPKYNIATSEKSRERGFKDGVADIWKFFSVANQMANSALKGLFYGALTGITFLTGSWFFKSLPSAFEKQGPKLSETILHPLKHISKPSKFIAGIASAAVLAYQLIVGKMDANQKTAVIDHKLHVGHRNI